MPTLSKTDVPIDTSQAEEVLFHRLLQYVACAGIGILGGGTGVATAIGLVVVIQSLLFPTVIIAPGTIILTITTTLTGLGVSWLLNRLVRRLLPNLFAQLDERGVQIIYIFSVLTSLLQTFLFTRTL
jgi:hypothetical protein